MAYGKTKMGKKMNTTTEPGDGKRMDIDPNPQPSKANTKKVYDPKTRVTYLVDKNTGRQFAASVPGPKFRPKLPRGAR